MKPADNNNVRFRELRLADSDALYGQAFGHPEVSRFLQWDTHSRVEQTQALVEEMMGLHQREENFIWAAVGLEDDRLVGLGSIKFIDSQPWIGFLVLATKQRQGVGSAILSALETATLSEYQTVFAATEDQNLPSIQLLLKNGWVEFDNPAMQPLKTFQKSK